MSVVETGTTDAQTKRAIDDEFEVADTGDEDDHSREAMRCWISSFLNTADC